jgi:ATP synthase protein I
MVRPTFRGASVRSAGHGARVFAMATNDSRDGTGSDSGDPGDVDLSARLQRLEKRLDKARKSGARRADVGGSSGSHPSAMGKAFRLSTEFMAGVIAGAGLGWAIDSVAGTRPWGLMVLTMLGFAAGIWNVMRSAGFGRPPSGRGGGDASGVQS